MGTHDDCNFHRLDVRHRTSAFDLSNRHERSVIGNRELVATSAELTCHWGSSRDTRGVYVVDLLVTVVACLHERRRQREVAVGKMPTYLGRRHRDLERGRSTVWMQWLIGE